MGGRYWITGTQLGMLKAFKGKGMDEERQKLIEEVIDKQFIENMPEPYKDYEIVIRKKR